MQTKTDIEFEQLVRLAKSLPKEQWVKLKLEVERPTGETVSDIESFLLTAPTFSEEQIEEITNTRNRINQWRSK